MYKYTDADADVAMPLTDLGIDPDTDLADQYPFTKTTASDQNGVQRGSTWQCCPGLLVYWLYFTTFLHGKTAAVSILSGCGSILPLSAAGLSHTCTGRLHP